MNYKKFLTKSKIPYFLDNNEKVNEIKKDCLEMARLKSDFDIDKFTVASQGDFIAHKFHFLMRQYSLALHEAKRMVIDREEQARKIKEWEDGKVEEGKYPDLEIERCKNSIELTELSLANKLAMIDRFEILRVKLTKENGKPFTDKQYQAEEPAYWKWFLTQRAREQVAQAQTGIQEGVWLNINFLEAEANLNPENKVKMLDKDGRINLDVDQNIKKIKKQLKK